MGRKSFYLLVSMLLIITLILPTYSVMAVTNTAGLEEVRSLSWTKKNTGVTGNFNYITNNGQVFVAGASDGNFVVSSDGDNWTLHQNPLGVKIINKVFWDGERFFAIGEGQFIIHSADGKQWSIGRQGGSHYFWDIARNGNQYFVSGNDGRAYSTDGLNWQAVDLNTNQASCALISNNHEFVWIQGPDVKTSVDGQSWTNQATLSGFDAKGLAWNGSTYVAVGNGIDPNTGAFVAKVYTSNDLVSWTESNTGTNKTGISDVHWDGTYFIATANNRVDSEVLFSVDGIHWTSTNIVGEPYLASVSSLNGTYIAVGEAGNVYKARMASKNADLSTLALSEGSLNPIFSPDVTNYAVSVPNTNSRIIVTVSTHDIHSTMNINGSTVANDQGSSPVDLVEGENLITINVTAEDGVTTKTYTVTVNRGAPVNIDELRGKLLNSKLSSEVDFYSESITNSGYPAESSSLIDAIKSVITAEQTKVQNNYDAAVLKVNGVSSSSDKTVLSGRLMALQALINATNAVAIAEGSKIQSDVDTAKGLVDALTNGPDKDILLQRISVVQQIITDANNASQALISATNAVVNAENTKIQSAVDAAKALVVALPNGPDKDGLLQRIIIIQQLIENQNRNGSGNRNHDRDRNDSGGGSSSSNSSTSTKPDKSDSSSKPESKTETAKTEPNKTEPAKKEPVKSEPSKSETPVQSSFVLGSPIYKVNGKTFKMDTAPLVKYNRIYVPVRYAAQSLGISNDNVKWDGKTRTVTIVKGDIVIKFTINSNTMTVNGKTVKLDVPAISNKKETNNRVMLPYRYIAENLGAEIIWDQESKSVGMRSK